MANKQTAGREQLGEFAPKFAELHDDVLFGDIWAREEELSPRDRSMITASASIADCSSPYKSGSF
ncbi:carboxymuconolactone decarboxylase family protein [Bacillus subtilis]|uniref:carboxymuconolactone decarboxylase family protein n=1 Tax=Bacillus subtilis TaxID=1423 RepID=UPI0009B53EF8|nr:carboxymuconolactone decarboxylase family protein [Bacillus subtilis]MDX7994493.1 carboxymuconolactone decarboxylase family protein [Bacillus subtilis]